MKGCGIVSLVSGIISLILGVLSYLAIDIMNQGTSSTQGEILIIPALFFGFISIPLLFIGIIIWVLNRSKRS